MNLNNSNRKGASESFRKTQRFEFFRLKSERLTRQKKPEAQVSCAKPYHFAGGLRPVLILSAKSLELYRYRIQNPNKSLRKSVKQII